MNTPPKKIYKVALLGNPNSGKSTVFNELTGMRQRTGNFPGITVDAHVGHMRTPSGKQIELTDFPGTYSVYATSSDERLVVGVLLDPINPHYPDAVIYVADVTHLEKHLLLLTQLVDLGLPVVLALNMADTAAAQGFVIHPHKLSESLGIPVTLVSARTGDNMTQLLIELDALLDQASPKPKPFYACSPTEKNLAERVAASLGIDNPYRALLLAHHSRWAPILSKDDRIFLQNLQTELRFQPLSFQINETLSRFEKFGPMVRAAVRHPDKAADAITDRIDNVLTHRIAGPVVFVGIMLLIFQAIFDWSEYPMGWIETGFLRASAWVNTALPQSWLTELLADGILAGLSGIMVFVPQIAILFLLITILEEIGYMSRVVFMFDRILRQFGMNGRSVIALIGGSACAVPAIMSARTISNARERLITILVTPYISCSARIPVYLVLIGLAVPAVKVWGFINAQTLVFAAMYALGILAAFGAGFLLKKTLPQHERSYLAIELPAYRMPHWKNVWLTVWEKVRAFVIGAGKIILYVSIALWALSRYGPGDAINQAEAQATQWAAERGYDESETQVYVEKLRLEASYAGILGRTIEPAIRPLGYDWKIGIALLTSFAAREVFTGTLAVLYNMGGDSADEINNRSENEVKNTLRSQMRNETFSDTGKPVYTFASALSLLIFYALAMQCMSTLAVVRRETGSWRWPLLQFGFMSGLAYLFAMLVYQLVSAF